MAENPSEDAPPSLRGISTVGKIVVSILLTIISLIIGLALAEVAGSAA